MRVSLPSPMRRHSRSRGQSLVEFALVVPVLLLITLVAIDFGRIFLGWVNLQQMTRVAAGYASEHASAWGTPGDATDQARYKTKVSNDARLINCDLPDPLPIPQVSGTALGSPVTVELSCEFSIITPIISNILGGTVLVSAHTTYPVREGAVAVVPGGGSPIAPPPEARFITTPQSGWSDLEVTFTDESLGAPSSWIWDFSEGAVTGTGSGSVDQNTATSQGPWTITYSCTGLVDDTCVFSVSLQVANAGGSDSVTETSLITVTVPPDTGPIADFTATPASGVEPLNVDFDFVDLRLGTVNYTAWEWDFENDGTFDASGLSTSHAYATDGTYDVRLRVTDDALGTNQIIKIGAVVVSNKECVVPDFANVKKNSAQGLWATAGFTTTVQKLPPNGNYDITYQSLIGGTRDPQPDGCDSTITVGP